MLKLTSPAASLGLLALTLMTGGCPGSAEDSDSAKTSPEKSLPAKQLDHAKAEIDAATQALEVKAKQVGEGSLAE
jgi:hypothetical protein